MRRVFCVAPEVILLNAPTDHNHLLRDRRIPLSRLLGSMLLLLALLGLQLPEVVAVEDEVRTPGWDLLEADAPEPSADDGDSWIPVLGATAVDPGAGSSRRVVVDTPIARAHPARTEQSPRAPPF